MSEKDENELNSEKKDTEATEKNAKLENDKPKTKNQKLKLRTIIVIIAIILFALGVGIAYRASYVEMQEIGQNYVEVFSKNLTYKLIIGSKSRSSSKSCCSLFVASVTPSE